MKLEVCFLEGETYNISGLSIYFDLKTKQYRHLFFCDDCGVKVGCVHYESLKEAIKDVEFGCICEACRAEEVLNDLDVEILLVSLNTDHANQVIEFGQNLASQLFDETLQFYGITRERIKAGKIPWNSIVNILCDAEKYQELQDYTISLMTEEEKRSVTIKVDAQIAGNFKGTARGEAIANI